MLRRNPDRLANKKKRAVQARWAWSAIFYSDRPARAVGAVKVLCNRPSKAPYAAPPRNCCGVCWVLLSAAAGRADFSFYRGCCGDQYSCSRTHPRELGRASCRERVCQYVAIAVVGVAVHQTTRIL